jgi:diguanylate cyclase (GGDEF)-like protein
MPADTNRRSQIALLLRLAASAGGLWLAGSGLAARLRAGGERDRRRVYEQTLDANMGLRRELAQERRRARYDALTKCLNHGAIIEELDTLVREGHGRSFAVAVIDLDCLKAINDQYGHQTGDAALVLVADALRRAGAVVGRWGGDEFVAVLPGADREQAERYRDAVVNALQEEGLTGLGLPTKLPIVASVGLATFPDEARTTEELLNLADNAMYAERRRPGEGRTAVLRFDSERVTKLISDIVPLLTSRGNREEKLQTVAQHLSVGAGYDAVNIEVAGAYAASAADWERTVIKAPDQLLQAWIAAQKSTDNHPLGALLNETRQPLFVEDIAKTELLTTAEREILMAVDLVCGLVVPMVWHDELVGMLSVASRTPQAFGPWDAHFLTAVATHVTAIVFTTELVDELGTATSYLAGAHEESVLLLAAAAEAYDDRTGSHLHRVRDVTEALARELGYSQQDARELGLASVLHDVGKIRVPPAVLTSPRGLSDEEWNDMRRHTLWGAGLLSGRRGFDLATLVARSHHERWDGAGYPDSLAGEAIPEAAAIVAVADSFDAMTSDRPYRDARPAEEAIAEINACAGTQFSPRVVAALNALYERGELCEGAVVEVREAA